MSSSERMTDVDFGRRSDDYAAYRPGFPPAFFDRIDAMRAFEGLHALDVGTGPGMIALELAIRGATVVGVDIAQNQIRAARERAEELGLDGRCTFVVGPAEVIGVDDASFDLATAGQCWHWFDESAAMAEMQRVLRPGGLLAVAHDCYLARHDELARLSEELVLQFNPDWNMADASGLYPEQIDGLIGGGFELVEQFCFDHDHEFTHAAWRGRMRTCNGVGSGSLSEDEVEAFDRALAELMRERFREDRVPVRHRVWATVVRRP